MHDVTIIPPDNHRPASSPVYQQCTIPPIRGAIQSMFVSCPGRHPGIARSHPISWRVPQPSPPTATGTPDRRLLEFESDGSDPNVSGTLTGSGQGTNQPSLGSVRVQALKAVATGRSALALWKGRPVPVARGSRCPGAVRSLPCPSRRQEITGWCHLPPDPLPRNPGVWDAATMRRRRWRGLSPGAPAPRRLSISTVFCLSTGGWSCRPGPFPVVHPPPRLDLLMRRMMGRRSSRPWRKRRRSLQFPLSLTSMMNQHQQNPSWECEDQQGAQEDLRGGRQDWTRSCPT
ncbi:PAXIP1-associated glutamate-rich protein 1 isoform X2 [Narcine bancroftii]|uniref:PAXIP1-associated glutamate-rich protein 1 isoform X2 n=1 Tax=Narcine bancroftii TaxID=1343680 RepID=UPI003832303C